jgi:hypothetical protein
VTTESALQHHLQCFGAGDLNGIISDYTEKSVLLTQYECSGGLGRSASSSSASFRVCCLAGNSLISSRVFTMVPHTNSY